MTLREEQLLQVQGSQKGRSASFCVGAQSDSAGGGGVSGGASDVRPAGWNAAAPVAREQDAAARRSQSCRVQGARPRVRRRTNKGEALDLADAAASSTSCLQHDQQASYHPFLHKAPSCGKVFYQTAEGPVMQTYTPEGSPVCQRRAARRPPLPNVATPEDSPSLARRPVRSARTGGGGGGGSGGGRNSPSCRFKKRPQEPDPDDPDAYRLRNFSLTAKGIVNRGDSFRLRRSSAQSGGSQGGIGLPAAAEPAEAAAAATAAAAAAATTVAVEGVLQPPPSPVSSFTVALLGATGVGKTALIDQFMTSECTNAYDRDRAPDCSPGEQKVCIQLDGEESELSFININNPKAELTAARLPDALLVVYSVIDKVSFERAEHQLSRLQALDLPRNRCLVLVGNKIDVVRSRVVYEADGMELACSYNAKFIEISVGMNHNCDELLVGLLHQARLKRSSYEPEQKEHTWTRSKGLVRASRKVKRTFTKIFGKEDSRLRNVTNFRVHN